MEMAEYLDELLIVLPAILFAVRVEHLLKEMAAKMRVVEKQTRKKRGKQIVLRCEGKQ